MGDRAHVYVHEGDRAGVWIYTHWSGTRLPALVAAILDTPEARGRLNDTGYFTRILIDGLTADADPSLGWGVDTEPGDTTDGYRVVVIDTAVGTVQLTRQTEPVGPPLSVDQYVASRPTWTTNPAPRPRPPGPWSHRGPGATRLPAHHQGGPDHDQGRSLPALYVRFAYVPNVRFSPAP